MIQPDASQGEPSDAAVDEPDAARPDAAIAQVPGPDCRFSFTSIDPPPGFAMVAARGLNEHDAALMQAFNQDDHFGEAFIWHADGTLVIVGLPPSVASREVWGFNDLEQVAGEYSVQDASSLGLPTRAFVWTAGVTYDLAAPDLSGLTVPVGTCGPAEPARVSASARDINNRGIAVGTASPVCGGGGTFAVRWQSGVPTLLATFEASARRITEGGAIFGDNLIFQNGGYEVVTSPLGRAGIADLNERGDRAVAIEIPDDPLSFYGHTAAEIRQADGRVRRLQALPTLPAVGVADLNGSGVAVGSSWRRSGFAETERYDARAVYWLDEQAIDLNLLLEGSAAPLLMEADYLNDRGRIVAHASSGAYYLLVPKGDCFPR